MPIPKTESRLPFNFTAPDLGEAFVSPDNHAALISYYASPLAQGRRQDYVLMVFNNALQTNLHQIKWQVNNLDRTDQNPLWNFTPQDTGSIQVTATLLDNGGAELRSLSLTQTVSSVNQDLENLIDLDDATHPVAGDPATSREIINDLLVHLHAIAQVPAQEILNRLLFGLSYIEALDHPQADREQLLGRLRGFINSDQASSFIQNAVPGAGICRLRPEILAMTIQHSGSPVIPWEELPADDAQRQTALTRIRTSLTTMDETHRIDLFNILRFPKASLKAAQMIIDNLRTRLFGGNTLNVIMNNSANATRLIDQFKTGPKAATP